MAKKLQNSAREVQSIAGAGCHLKNPQAQNRRHVARMVLVFILGSLRNCRANNRIEPTHRLSTFSLHRLLSAALDLPVVVLAQRGRRAEL